MKVECYPIGDLQENCYLLKDNNEVVFIDPGKHAKILESHVNNDEKVVGILLTHGHDDHIGAVDDLANDYQCPVYIHKNDEPLVTTFGNAYTGGSRRPLTCNLSYYPKEFDLGQFHFVIYETPGHTSGSVLIRYRNVLFTGDTLFAQDCGRTDLFSGSEEEMNDSLKFINTLENDLKVYPGHGPASTIGLEKQMNYYLNHTF